MAANREACFVALTTRLEAIEDFELVSRTVRSWDDVGPGECPAGFLVKASESVDARGGMAPPIWTLEADFVIYCKNREGRATVPSTQLNALLTAVESALQRQPTEPPNPDAIFANNPDMMWGTTLGGLCYTCAISGTIEVFEGVIGGGAVAIVPIQIITSGVGS